MEQLFTVTHLKNIVAQNYRQHAKLNVKTCKTFRQRLTSEVTAFALCVKLDELPLAAFQFDWRYVLPLYSHD